MKGVPIYNVEYKRFLDEREAATYSGMGLREFRRDCAISADVRAGGKKVWDVNKLDMWLDGSPRSQSSEIENALNGLA